MPDFLEQLSFALSNEVTLETMVGLNQAREEATNVAQRSIFDYFIGAVEARHDVPAAPPLRAAPWREPRKPLVAAHSLASSGVAAAAVASARGSALSVRDGVSPPAPRPVVLAVAAALSGGGGGLPSSAGGGGVSPPAPRRAAVFAARAPSGSGGGGALVISAGAAVKKLRRLASWAVERGCPSGCHNFLDTVSKGKPTGCTSVAGFKHQHGCAIKYAIGEIRRSSSTVSDPGGYTYSFRGAILGKMR